MNEDMLAKCRNKELAAELMRRPMIIGGRASSSSGKKAHQLAADDLIGAGEKLEAREGIKVGHLLPARDELMERLGAAPTSSSKDLDGKRFTHQYLVIDHVGEFGVLFVCICGTGVKLDQDLDQPALDFLAKQARRLKPALVWGKRIDRLGKDKWSFAELMKVLEHFGPSWIGDERFGAQPADNDMTGFQVFFSAAAAHKDAVETPPKTRDGYVKNSGSKMVGGRVEYHYPGPVVPGLARISLEQDGKLTLVPYLFFDSPAFLPGPSEKAVGVPEVFDASGNHVDQLAIIRGFYHRFGLGKTQADLGEWLAANQYSTDSYRRKHGKAATMPIAMSSKGRSSWVRGITKHFQFHKTGYLTVHLGVKGVADPVIYCLPPEGFIDPADVPAVEARLAGGARFMALGGMRLVYNGVKCVALGDGESDYERYVLNLEAGYPEKRTVPPLHKHLRHRPVVESILAGFGAALTRPIQPANSPHMHEPDPAVVAAIADLDTKITELTTRLAGLERQINETDETGARIWSGAAARNLNDQYNVTHGELETSRRDRVVSADKLEMAKHPERGLPLDLVSRFISGVRDQRKRGFLAQFPGAIQGLDVRVKRVRRHRHPGWLVSWSGEVHLDDGEQSWCIPFSGSYLEGAPGLVDERIRQIIKSMRMGVPFWDSGVPNLQNLVWPVSRRLGKSGHLLTTCTDPRLLRIGMALRADHLSTKEAAITLAEPMPVVSAVADSLDSASKTETWHRVERELADMMCISAAANNGLALFEQLVPKFAGHPRSLDVAKRRHFPEGTWTSVPFKGHRITPCRCGATMRARLGIREPRGLVCLVCREDEEGNVWPADPYDRYVVAPDLWTELVPGSLLEGITSAVAYGVHGRR